ncbi:MAG: hypothetical protein JWM93_1108 [Frankiales bacterium]|nr:hypothetical protein [Frankiales bacterium]
MSKRLRRAIDRARSDDSGFTLVELVVAMVITLLVMSSLLGVLVQSLSSIAKSKQRQTATALATEATEALRALPYNEMTLDDTAYTLSAYRASWPTNTDINYAGASLKIAADGCCEPLRHNQWSPRTIKMTRDNVDYFVTTYVTAPVVAADAEQYFNLTTKVTYESNVSGGKQSSVQHSTAYSPTGCLDTSSRPYSGVCQSYFTIQSGVTNASVQVVAADDSVVNPSNPGGIDGVSAASDVNEVRLGLPSLTTNLSVEQIASGRAAVSLPDGSLRGADDALLGLLLGGMASAAAVDTDPSYGDAETSTPAAISQGSTSTSTVGTGGELAVTAPSGSGQVVGAVAATSTQCTGASGLGLTTGATILHPCLSGNAQQTADGTVVYRVNPGGTGGVVEIPVASIGAWATPARAVAAQLTVGGAGGVCGTPDANGCGHARATRTLPSAVFGAIPSAYRPSDTSDIRSFFTSGSWAVSQLAEDVYAESGTGHRAPSATRSGTLKVWCGSALIAGCNTSGPNKGYRTQTLTAGTSLNWSSQPLSVSFNHGGPGGGVITFTVQSSVTVNVAQTKQPATVTTCTEEDCAYSASLPDTITGQTTVLVQYTTGSGTTTLANFVVAANLGSLTATSTTRVGI